jgi:hypothetical protein
VVVTAASTAGSAAAAAAWMAGSAGREAEATTLDVTWAATGIAELTTFAVAGTLTDGASTRRTSACAGAHVQHAATATTSPMTLTIWGLCPRTE